VDRERKGDEQLVARLRGAHEIYSPALHEGLRATLTERTFPPHPRFKGKKPPPLDDADAQCGIHIIYCYPDWQVVIGGLSRAAAWKCGVRIPIDLRAKTPWDDDPGGESVVDAAVRWVIDAWRGMRHVAPELRGFISEHDGGEMIDLDSGEVVPDDQVAMGPR
jgi:hypothetical protein